MNSSYPISILSLLLTVASIGLSGCSQDSPALAESFDPVAESPVEPVSVPVPMVQRTPRPPLLTADAPPGTAIPSFEPQPPPPQTPTPAPPAPPSPIEIAFQTLLRPGVSTDEWETAHQALIGYGVAAVPVLRDGLNSTNPLAREWAASLLALNTDAAKLATKELTECLTDPSGYVRANAAAALAFVPGNEEVAAPVFVELISSPDPQLRRLAAMNLGTLPTLSPAQVRQVSTALGDSDPEVVRPIVDLLGRIGPSAKPALPKLQQIAFEQTVDESLQSAAQQAVQLIQAE
jgi:hypothetical protein